MVDRQEGPHLFQNQQDSAQEQSRQKKKSVVPQLSLGGIGQNLEPEVPVNGQFQSDAYATFNDARQPPQFSMANYATQQNGIPTETLFNQTTNLDNRLNTDSLQTYGDMGSGRTNKKPPVAFKQEELYFLPSKPGSSLLFDTRSSYNSRFNRDSVPQNYYGPRIVDRDLVAVNKHEITSRSKVAIRESKKEFLGHQSLRKAMSDKDTLAVGYSPDQNIVAVLLTNFEVHVIDIKQDLQVIVVGLSNSNFYDPSNYFQGTNKQIEPDEFKVFVSNGFQNLIVQNQRDNSVWIWANKHSTQVPDKFAQTQQAPLQTSFSARRANSASRQMPEGREGAPKRKNSLTNFFRSNSSRSRDVNDNQSSSRSKSRLKEFFSGSIFKKDQLPPNKKGRVKTVVDSKEMMPEKKKQKEPTMLVGEWTNVTLRAQTQVDKNTKPLCRTFAVKFKEAPYFSSESLGIHGSRGVQVDTKAVKEEINIVQVQMYEKSSYFASFMHETEQYLSAKNSVAPTPSQTPRPILEFIQAKQSNLDTSAIDQKEEKLLVFNHQSISQDQLQKGDVWFQSQFFLVDMQTQMTKIDYMGLIEDEPDKNLICQIDNQGSLMVVVVNSVHMLFCQIVFTNLKTSFVTSMKLYEFVSPCDAPPFDKRGKTNLQVDDIAWTKNDAFVLLLFNTGAVALLPRLGSQLLAFHNPTLVNVNRKDAHLFEQYKLPRGFNELIMNSDTSQKVRKAKNLPLNVDAPLTASNQGSRFQITIHPQEECFIVYDSYVAYVFRLELEPELSELFDRKNMSYYFMRFCFSINKLAIDPDILEKVPQLLTSKLPLFEFDKNDEKFQANENEQAASRIVTASQINPFKREEKRMETNQSFNADFNEDPEIVLLNFKHLLFSFRWNQSLTINYLQWLVTVVNDCFFFFLKKSEPIYAFHVLAIADFYIKKVLHKSETLGKLQGPSKLQVTGQTERSTKDPKPAPADSVPENNLDSKEHFMSFVNTASRLMDPTQEIYCNMPGKKDKERKQDLNKALKAAEKMKLSNQFLQNLPHQVITGNGNVHFQFQKNYVLLVFYSLIQFRNYQASNFNIIFLLFACYIVQKYLSAVFVKSLNQVIDIVEHNYKTKRKTDEFELFFGKSGRNHVTDAPSALKLYSVWATDVLQVSNNFLQKFYNSSYHDTILESCLISGIQSDNFKRALSNLDYMKEIGPSIQAILHLEKGNLKQVLALLKTAHKESITTRLLTFKRIPTQNLGYILFNLANTVYHQMFQQGANRKSASITGLLYTVSQLSIKLDKRSPINCISQHSKVFDTAYQRHSSKKLFTSKDVMTLFDCHSKTELARLVSLLFFYLGDQQRGAQMLDPAQNCRYIYGKTPTSLKQRVSLQLYRLLLLSNCLKSNIKQYEKFKELLKDFDIKTVTDLKLLLMTTERLNVVHAIKYCVSLIKNVAYQTFDMVKKSTGFSQVLWSVCGLLPFGLAQVIKEEVCQDAIKSMKSILFYLKSNPSKCKIKKTEKVLQRFPLAQKFLTSILKDSVFCIEYVLGDNPLLRERFYQQLEVVLICFYDQSNQCVIHKSVDQILNEQDQQSKDSKGNDYSSFQFFHTVQDKTLFDMHLKLFNKWTKILLFLKFQCDILSCESSFKHYVFTKQLGESENNRALLNQKLLFSLSLHIGLFNCSKYANLQLALAKAIKLLHHLIFSPDILNLNKDKHTSIICQQLSNIDYQKLSRLNKKSINNLLDACRNKLKATNPVVKQLENTIFSGSELNKQKQEFQKSFQEFGQWVTYLLMNDLDWKGFNKAGEKDVIITKKLLVENGLKLREVFGLDMDSSLFFRGSSFEIKSNNVVGLSEKLLDNYLKMKAGGVDHSTLDPLADESMLARRQNLAEDSIDVKDKAPDTQEDEDALNASALIQEQEVQDGSADVKLPPIGLNYLMLKSRQLYGQNETPRKAEKDSSANINIRTFLYNKRSSVQKVIDKPQPHLKRDKKKVKQEYVKNPVYQEDDDNKEVSDATLEPPKNSKEHQRTTSQIPLSTPSGSMFLSLENISDTLSQSKGQKELKEALKTGRSANDELQKTQEIRLNQNATTIQQFPKIQKISLRKNSVRRNLSAGKHRKNNQSSVSKRITNKYGMPPKPVKTKVSKEGKEEAVGKIVTIFERYYSRKLLSKLAPQSRRKQKQPKFNVVLVKQSSQNGKFQIKNPKEYFSKSAHKDEPKEWLKKINLKQDVKPFDLVKVKPRKLVLPSSQSQQQLQFVKNLDKAEPAFDSQAKLRMLKRLKQKIDAVQLQANSLKIN